MTTYPDNIIRGIPNNQYIDEFDNPRSNLFLFHERDTNEDGLMEQSINWEDDKESIRILMNQPKDNDEFQFKIGVARIPLSEINRINALPKVNGAISYERKPLDGNSYHGNLLLQSNVRKDLRYALASTLSLAVSKVIPRENSV